MKKSIVLMVIAMLNSVAHADTASEVRALENKLDRCEARYQVIGTTHDSACATEISAVGAILKSVEHDPDKERDAQGVISQWRAAMEAVGTSSAQDEKAKFKSLADEFILGL